MKDKCLINRLKEYSRSDFYPFHMPGHKRQIENGVGADFPNPFSIDITEIDGFDNLHHAVDVLRESMEWAASVYGADKTFYLVNGSSCGILSAIGGTVTAGGKILVSRNCHKSVYNGIFLNHLESEYIYPQFIDNFGISGGLSANDVDNLLARHSDIQAVLVVSPTYEGIVSDIGGIAEAAHRHNVPLIVDEAHGAHFAFGEGLPVSALELGADVVIQSVHKTLPSMTQTALLHIKEGLVDAEKIEQYLHIYQSSSPSYVLMASIERCIDWMDGDGRKRMGEYLTVLEEARKRLGDMKHLKILDRDQIGYGGIYDLDITKIVISTKGTSIDGAGLDDILRKEYHLEMEMCGPESVVALTSLMDTEEGLKRLVQALTEVDAGLTDRETENQVMKPVYPKIKFKIADALAAPGEPMEWRDAVGRVSAEYVYIYPPGIPIIAPGEVLQEDLIEKIIDYKKRGLFVQGLKDESLKMVRVVPANVMRRMIWEKYFM
ncbi:decarboxylase [Clostridium sp. MCC353]|uniref:aminotransferase class I/II-fold pyridoxal phosphate-dependent enzyme n=1 Tax=Clostridium sp. MCC353 TaxID=2592646 RepID=UPI001C02271A|nr:PLP-dependent transferase [Clostridium sp. MCC353]MBT9774996.1 decarboxylase [Clostridium sp. MCC353]